MGFLRTYLALAVVIAHTSPLFGYFGLPPEVAVRVFFIISGFYMAMICCRKYVGKRSLYAFYVGRFLRIYPLFYVALLIALAVQLTCKTPWYEYHMMRPNLSWGEKALLLLPNVTILGSDIPFLISHDITTGWHFSFGLPLDEFPEAKRLSGFVLNGPAWTLGNELLFYLLVPFLARLRTPLVLLLAAVSWALQYYLEYNAAWSSYFFFPANLVYFLIGMLCFRFYASQHFSNMKAWVPVGWATIAIYLLIMLLVLRQYIPGYRNYGWMVYPVVVILIPWLFDRSKNSTWDRIVGEFSYPVYILHAPLMLALTSTMGSAEGWVTVPLAVLISYVLILTIEHPLESYRQKLVAAILNDSNKVALA